MKLLWKPLLFVAVLCTVAIPPTVAQANPTAAREAGLHFERGVSLYSEADYSAALVEFKKAYDVSPNPTVLYNLGQTYYQLQNYATSLITLQKYLVEAGAKAPHRAEVETTLETLRGRVGRVDVKSNLTATEISIDDEPVGRVPLLGPVLVSIGRRKITGLHEGSPPVTLYVNVAAGEEVPAVLTFSQARPSEPRAPVLLLPSKESTGFGDGLITFSWATTGVITVGTVTMGLLALNAQSELRTTRSTFGVTRANLDNAESKTKTYALVTDILGAATVVSAGLSLYFTLHPNRETPKETAVKIGVAPTGLLVQGAF